MHLNRWEGVGMQPVKPRCWPWYSLRTYIYFYRYLSLSRRRCDLKICAAHVKEAIQKLDAPEMSDFICIFLGPSHQQNCADTNVHSSWFTPFSKHLSFPDWEREGAKDFGEGGKRTHESNHPTKDVKFLMFMESSKPFWETHRNNAWLQGRRSSKATNLDVSED